MHAPPPTQSRAARYAFMLVLGLLIAWSPRSWWPTHYERGATRCPTA